MKKSAYNYFVGWRQFLCGVNLLTGRKIVLTKIDYTWFESDLTMLSRELYQSLIKGGFLVEDDVDEYARLLHRRNDSVFFNNNTFQLTILPTLECNFRCWYCYEKHIKSKMTPQTYHKILKYIDYIIDHHPIFNFHLDWFGGEPLINFDEIVKPISTYVKDTCLQHKIFFSNTMTTNGYLISDERIKDINDINLHGFQITLDGYEEMHNKIRFQNRGDDSYSIIIGNINKLCLMSDDATVNIRINYTNKNLNNIGLIADDIQSCNRKKVYFTFQRVWQTLSVEDDKTVEKLLDEQISYIESRGIKVKFNQPVYCQGVRCYADTIRQSVISYDGALFKCTARDFANNSFSVGFIKGDGTPHWNANYYKHYLKPVFDNDSCKGCLYLPICLGTCSQKFIEGGNQAIQKECKPDEWAESIKEELLQNLYDYLIANK